MEVLYLRSAEDDGERGRLRSELYAPPAGRKPPRDPVRRVTNLEKVQRLMSDIENEDRELIRGR